MVCFVGCGVVVIVGYGLWFGLGCCSFLVDLFGGLSFLGFCFRICVVV